MKKNEDSTRLRGKLMLTGTLAMFAMGTLHSEASTPTDREKDDRKPVKPSTEDASAEEQKARASQEVHKFDIPAGTLAEVIAALGKATDLTIALPQKYASLPSAGVQGVRTTEEALTIALKGTNISADFISTDHVQLSLHAAGQDVTVTATSEMPSLKYTAPLRDLPQTITVIPENVLENTASTSLVEALRTVPGIAFGAGEGGNPTGDRPFIRGVDSQSSTFVDGMRDIGAQSREVFDLESVEVAKGPSGGYAGRAASGGSINLNSKMSRRENFLSGYYSPGTANFFRGAFDGNVKITRWMAGRLNGMWQNSDVAGRDIVNNKRYGFAPSLLFNITPRGRVFANYYELDSHDIPDPGIPYNNPTDYYNTTTNIGRPDGRARVYQVGDGQPLIVNRKNFYGFRGRDFRNEKVKTVFGRAEYNLSENTVLRNSYRWGKSGQDYVSSQADDSQGNIYYGLLYRRALNRVTNVDTQINQTDLSGRVKTGSIQHTYAAGGEFSRERSWNTSYTVGSLSGSSITPAIPSYFLVNPNTNTRMAYSASRCPVGGGAGSGYYCEDFLNPTVDDPFVGVQTIIPTQVGTTTAFTQTNYTNAIVKNNAPTRQISISKSVYGFDTIRFIDQLQATVGIRYDHYDSNYRNVLTCVPTATVPCTFATSANLVNYQAGVTYKPVKSGTIYGSVSNSSTPPGNALSQGQDGSAITSIVNQALPPEKTRSVEAGAKWEVFSTKALATVAFFQSNTENVRITLADSSIAAAGTRRNRGIDISMTGYTSAKWQIFGGYTFMQAILTNAGGAGAAAGLQDGRRFPNTPEHSFSITSYYQVTHKLNLGGGVYGSGKVYGADNPTTIYSTKWVPGYARVDIYGSYRFNPHIELQGNIQNLNNKTYFLQAYTTHYAALAPARQGRLTLNVRW